MQLLNCFGFSFSEIFYTIQNLWACINLCILRNIALLYVKPASTLEWLIRDDYFEYKKKNNNNYNKTVFFSTLSVFIFVDSFNRYTSSLEFGRSRMRIVTNTFTIARKHIRYFVDKHNFNLTHTYILLCALFLSSLFFIQVSLDNKTVTVTTLKYRNRHRKDPILSDYDVLKETF